MMKTFTLAMRYMAMVAIAFLMVQCNNKQAGNQESANTNDSMSVEEARLPIAYVQEDSLFAKYEFAKEITEKMISKEESLKATLNQKQRSLQNEANEFNRKLQNNAFLSQERAQQEAERLQKKEAEISSYAQNATQQLLIESEKKNLQVKDSILTVVKEFNQSKKFDVIFLKSSTLYIDAKYDITNELVDMLNKRYAASKKESK